MSTEDASFLGAVGEMLSWVSKSFRQDFWTFVQTIFQISTWKVFFIIIKNTFIVKSLTNFCKRWTLVWIRACRNCKPSPQESILELNLNVISPVSPFL